MDYRRLLVHLDDSADAARLTLAIGLARLVDAELAGTYLVPTRELTPFTSAMLPDAMVEYRLRDSGEAQASAEARFREAVDRAQWPRWSWSAPAGRAIDAAIQHARYADLCVLGQPQADAPHAGFARDLAHGVLMNAGRPALVVPHSNAVETIARTVLVAWKESRESARAVADALPLLKRAGEVVVVSIAPPGEESDRERLADAGVVAWLACHGIAARVRHEVAEDVDTGAFLLSRVADLGADLLVMGAYSRPRLSEIVLGGVTRTVLESMTVPVLMSH
ncbi:MAG: universal stress protein [Burkholderiales bacterium]|nr:universal stress protein [Burkholderiales bacterium]